MQVREKTIKKRLFFITIILSILFFSLCTWNGFLGIQGQIVSPPIIGILLSIILCKYRIDNNIRINLPPKIYSLLIIFVITNIVFSLFREGFISSLRNSLSTAIALFLVINISSIYVTIPINKAINAYINFIFYVLLPVNVFIQQYYNGGFVLFPDRDYFDNLRFYGCLYHAHLGMIFGFADLLLIIKILIRIKFVFFDIIKIVILTLAILYTDCRSAWGGLILSIVFFLIINKNKNLIQKFFICILFVCTVTYSVNYLFLNSSTVKGIAEDSDFREFIWNVGITKIFDHPIIGNGSAELFKTVDASNNYAGWLYDPHNAYIHLILVVGIPLAILLLSVYFKMFKIAYSRNKAILSIIIFWLFIPMFWGHIYNLSLVFMPIFVSITLFSILLHPQLSNLYKE